eukprot:Nk52_evm42s485 gene=Nk52_evmTU42s485
MSVPSRDMCHPRYAMLPTAEGGPERLFRLLDDADTSREGLDAKRKFREGHYGAETFTAEGGSGSNLNNTYPRIADNGGSVGKTGIISRIFGGESSSRGGGGNGQQMRMAVIVTVFVICLIRIFFVVSTFYDTQRTASGSTSATASSSSSSASHSSNPHGHGTHHHGDTAAASFQDAGINLDEL